MTNSESAMRHRENKACDFRATFIPRDTTDAPDENVLTTLETTSVEELDPAGSSKDQRILAPLATAAELAKSEYTSVCPQTKHHQR